MERRKLFTLLGAAAVIVLLICLVIGSAALRYARERDVPTQVTVPDVTLCDVNASSLCVISFGADYLNQMVINFHVPNKKYPSFYARVDQGGTSKIFPCGRTAVNAVTVYCVGERTPLGEPIDIKIFATKGDRLLAQGTLLVSAIALPTVTNGTVVPATEAPTEPPAATEPLPLTPPAGGRTRTPRPPIATPTLPTGYPNQ